MPNAYGRSTKDEAEFIRSLIQWPRWPWMPLKHGDGRCGLIYADDIDLPNDKDANGPIRVFDMNLFTVTMKHAALLSAGVKCPWTMHGEYPNVEAMVEDGWVCD